MKQNAWAVLRKLWFSTIMKVSMITFAFIKILGLLKQFLCILVESRTVELLHLYCRTRYPIGVYYIPNVIFIIYRYVCTFLRKVYKFCVV